jgi:hypothetical protein
VTGEGSREPVSQGLGLLHEQGKSLTGQWRGKELFRYLYTPWDAQVEAPKPFFHPLRTLDGETVTLYRPHDHVWHKGLSWALANADEENFWGGHTWVTGKGYQQLDNDGTEQHVGFPVLEVSDERLRVVEELEWYTQSGRLMFTETRTLAACVHPDLGAWQLTHSSALTNTNGAPVTLGSPTTRGRAAAGYSGLLWRGPRSFAGGDVVTPDGVGGDELMGRVAPWLGFSGRHDGSGVGSTLVFRDHESNFNFPTQWFVRTGVYAVVCPAPWYDTEQEVADGDTVTLTYDIVIADGVNGVDGCARLADAAASTDLLAA